MAGTALDLLLAPALIEEAKADFRERLAGRSFVNPIPDDVNPPDFAKVDFARDDLAKVDLAKVDSAKADAVA